MMVWRWWYSLISKTESCRHDPLIVTGLYGKVIIRQPADEKLNCKEAKTSLRLLWLPVVCMEDSALSANAHQLLAKQ